MPQTIWIRIDFPALDRYVAYLRDTDTTQRQVDAAASQVQQITLALKQSGGRLSEATASQKP